VRRNLIIIVLVIAVATAIFAVKKRSGGHADATQYKLAAADLGPVSKTVSATGILQPWSTVDIKSKAGGRIDSLLVDVGSDVKNGQVVAKIDPTDTLLSVQTAQANIDSANARTAQSAQTFQLQRQQSQIDIRNAQASLQAAEANRETAAAKLADTRDVAGAQPVQTSAAIAEAQANYNQAVKQRQLLNSTNVQDRAAVQSAYDQAVANQKNAQAIFDRQNNLVAKGYVAQQSVDTAQAQLDVDKALTLSASEKLRTLGAQQQAVAQASDAAVAQAQAALQNAQAGSVDILSKKSAVRQAQAQLDQATAQVQEAKVALDQARANVANVGIKAQDIAINRASVAGNHASLTNAKTTLQQTTVRAPSDGVVLTKYVSQGTIISAGASSVTTGTAIVQLGDITRMYVSAAVDETDVASIDPGQSVEVDFDAYPGVPFDGKVARIDPQAVVNQNVTQFNVRVEIDNSTPTFRLLRPGMNATCNFQVAQKDNVLSVPNDAVQSDGDGAYVMVGSGGTPAPPDPTTGTPADSGALVGVKTKRREIQVGLEGDDATEITSGIKAGEKVVVQTIQPVVAPTTTGTSPIGGGGRGMGGGGRR